MCVAWPLLFLIWQYRVVPWLGLPRCPLFCSREFICGPSIPPRPHPPHQPPTYISITSQSTTSRLKEEEECPTARRRTGPDGPGRRTCPTSKLSTDTPQDLRKKGEKTQTTRTCAASEVRECLRKTSRRIQGEKHRPPRRRASKRARKCPWNPLRRTPQREKWKVMRRRRRRNSRTKLTRRT